jgi:hypothetical protein
MQRRTVISRAIRWSNTIQNYPITFKASDTTQIINSSRFQFEGYPESIIVSVVNKRSKDDDYLTDPAHFARIDSSLSS